MAEHEGHRALSFQEPFATLIVVGAKTVECRSRNIKTPIKDLVVCSSKTSRIFPPVPGLTYGYAIGLVDVVDCVPFDRKYLDDAFMTRMTSRTDHAWLLENARLIKPFPVKATASFYYVQHDLEVIPRTLEAYEEFILPYAYRSGDDDDFFIDDLTFALFNDPAALYEMFEL